MVNAKIENEIMYVIFEGECSYSDFQTAVDPIVASGQHYIGIISDTRQMIDIPARDQKLLAERHKNNAPDKPNALLMEKSGMLIIARIYLRFTKAVNTKIFTNEQEALAWVKGIDHNKVNSNPECI